MTASCGIAQYPVNSGDIKTVIDYADKALYHAKETGRNKTVCYDEISIPDKYK
jgi:PleD family two-component response regulator